jgi:hypothetical protein
VRRLADDPALCGKVFQPLGILGMAVRVCPMLFAVILDADLPFGPTHIDAAPPSAGYKALRS